MTDLLLQNVFPFKMTYNSLPLFKSLKVFIAEFKNIYMYIFPLVTELGKVFKRPDSIKCNISHN